MLTDINEIPIFLLKKKIETKENQKRKKNKATSEWKIIDSDRTSGNNKTMNRIFFCSRNKFCAKIKPTMIP